MNVVLLSDTAIVNGGAAKVVLDDARILAAGGHRVLLICGAGPIAPELQGIPNLTVQSLAPHDIADDPNRLRAMANGWWNPRVHRAVHLLLSDFSPDDTIIHLHSWTKALSSSAIRAALDLGFPMVMTIHDYLLACPTGTLFLQNSLEKCSLRPLSLRCLCTNCDVRSYSQKIWRVGRRLAQDWAGGIPHRLRHFIVYSRLSQEILAPHLPADSIFYPVRASIEVERREPENVTSNDTFVFLGRLTPEKGVELFARAAAAEQVPALFIGEGLARESILRANPRARLAGWMSHRDGIEALRSARALVFPSLWHETLGLVVLEAAANGIPAIVPDTCAARESVIDGVTGLIFRSGDESDLRRALARLKDPDVAARMGREAYQKFWAAPGWGMDLHRRQLEAVYAEVLAARSLASLAAREPAALQLSGQPD